MEKPVVNELVVTGPLRERLFDLFTQVYAGRYDVRVIMDRRQDDGSQRVAQAEPDHRTADRRRRPPTWVFPPPD